MRWNITNLTAKEAIKELEHNHPESKLLWGILVEDIQDKHDKILKLERELQEMELDRDCWNLGFLAETYFNIAEERIENELYNGRTD